MNLDASKVTIHMVSSLDGFIGKKDGDVSWMHTTDHFDKGVTLTPEAIDVFLKGIDCYVMGSKTYEHALKLGWPYGETPVVVLTTRNLESNLPTVEFYSGDLIELVHNQLKPKFKNIWMVGGPSLTKDFLIADLVDEIVLTILPVILGEGLLFFDYIGQEIPLHLKEVTAYKEGIVELIYQILKPSPTNS